MVIASYGVEYFIYEKIWKEIREVYECSNECTAVGTCVKDLCLMKDVYYLPVFDQQNIMNMIYELC